VQPATAAVKAQAIGTTSKALGHRVTRCIAYCLATFAAICAAMSVADAPTWL
jgi:hypothetical protein